MGPMPDRDVPARRAPRLVVLSVPALLVVALLGACGGDADDTRSATAGLPDLAQALEAKDWVLDPEDSSVDGVEAGAVTLTFSFGDEGGDVDDDAGRASGRAPCNTYRTRVVVDDDGNRVRFEGLATTRMACDGAVMDVEARYLQGLELVTTADVTDPKRLVLSGEGDLRLSYEASDAS